MRPRDLTGQVALVTGAARRLGRDLALALARHGADVFVHHNRHAAEARATVAEIERLGRRAWAVQADFLDADGPASVIRTVAATTGRLDVLVNNVGNYLVKPVEETTADEWRGLLEANLIAPFTLVRESLGLFPVAGGHVINIGYAGVEHLAPNVEATAYQVSKTGLLVLTRSFAKRLGPRRIRVNMVSPGQLDNSVDLPDDLAATIPLARAGTGDDVADAVLYLVDPAGYTTGVNIDVAGGYRM